MRVCAMKQERFTQTSGRLKMKPMRKYLRPDGTERLPTVQENSHYGMARTELGAGWNGDAEDGCADA